MKNVRRDLTREDDVFFCPSVDLAAVWAAELLLLIFAAAHSSSRMVWPLGVSFAVEGQRMSKRLITGPFAFGAVGRAKSA